MKRVGIFICNFNKAEMVVKCVQAIRNQTYQNFDVYVVDNASDDGSVQLLRQTYGDTVTILQNETNLGGSGGFGRAIRTALEMDYPYFMLVDNDAFLDKYAVEELHKYMEQHSDVGICGAETLYLQEPSKIQDLGGKIDYAHFQWGGIIGGMMELSGSTVLECDYVASCSVMARTSAVRVFGGFPEENFIYWDDIEWCTKCWRAGYKVIVNGKAKTLHDMSGAGKKNMFLCYYSNRNRYKFFTKYLPKERLEEFFLYITEEFLSQNYGALHKRMYGSVFTQWNALDDFMHGVTGAAADGQIVPYTDDQDRLAGAIKQWNRILVYMPEHTQLYYSVLSSLLRYIMGHNENAEVMTVFTLEEGMESEYDMVFQLCEHVTKVKENIIPRVYVDKWRNMILDEKDYLYFSNYETVLENFRNMYRPLYQERIRELRGQED